MAPPYAYYLYIWPQIFIFQLNLVYQKCICSQQKLRLTKYKLIKNLTNEKSFKVFLTDLVEERKTWHLKVDNISKSQPGTIKILKLLIYKPVF